MSTTNNIQRDPKFHELVQQRNRLAMILSLVVIVIYFGFILLIAMAPEFITQPISSTSVIPLGMPMGVGVILASIFTTWVYVYQANNVFDHLIHDIIRDANK